MSDGTVKKTTVKETYAKVTTIAKKKENKDPDKKDLTRQTMRNRRISAFIYFILFATFILAQKATG